jgi:hypothetical protein
LEFAREWSGKHRRRLASDLDQALVLIGACYDGSGINASDTLKNEHFKPHVALKPLLEWLHRNGPDQTARNAASRAVSMPGIPAPLLPALLTPPACRAGHHRARRGSAGVPAHMSARLGRRIRAGPTCVVLCGEVLLSGPGSQSHRVLTRGAVA